MKTISALLFLFALACAEGPSSDASFEQAEGDYLTEEVEIAREQLTPEYTASKEVQEQKIIKTANLAFSTQKPEETHARILQLTQQYEGFVANDNAGKSYNRIYRNMTVRIPTANFQKFIDGISEGVEYFDRRDISRQDVTEEFVDLQARLKAKRELENRYLELLKQAKNVKEMLEIERELATIREEIEAKQGRLQYLQDRVSISTVSIEFYKETSETGVTVSYGQKIVNALKGGWDGVSVFFLGLLYLWPLFVIAFIIILVVRWFVRRKKKQ
ncbi:DUF4349 domain-containing protein [Luteirhabdus pelagi]|uniref:DUF4349 domain-containing protein n=1 Tax=Luteirhabdus pelagi TaxID=2792783 RepID=UPI0019395EC3|nr:DUF4349 domain-containing protein [Luteirhabdus pelagi]